MLFYDRNVRLWSTLIVLWTAAVPAFAQTDSDTNGTGTSHGFAVSDGDTVKFGRQLVRLSGRPGRGLMRNCLPERLNVICVRGLSARDLAY